MAALSLRAEVADSLNTHGINDSIAVDTLVVDTLVVDTLVADTLMVPETLDSLEAIIDTIVPVIPPFYTQWNDSDLTDIELRSLDWSLQWLDTTDCVAVHDTTTLPDSVYKARLQALPCVIELPYNDRVRAFIIRYVKRNPKQVARRVEVRADHRVSAEPDGSLARRCSRSLAVHAGNGKIIRVRGQLACG